MRAVVLAGGLGMRLRPYTTILPKPLVPVGDRPVLELILRRLAATGVTRVDVCIGHLGELVRAYFAEGTTLPEGLELVWHAEDEPLGTAGALGSVPGLDEPFIAVNGDVLTTLDIGELVKFHENGSPALTIAIRRRRVDIDLGVVESRDGVVSAFTEKPSHEYDVSMGIYVYDPRALAYLPGGECSFPELVQRLLEGGERVAAFQSDADWFDIGTLPEYERAVAELEAHPGLFDVP